MKKTFYILTLAAALTLAWGCSTSDEPTDNNVVGTGATNSDVVFVKADVPTWDVDMRGTEEPPQWTPPTPSLYENKMIVMLRLQDELVRYSTDDDVMAVFVGDECRALSHRSGSGSTIYFVLNIYGNATPTPEEFSIAYYCHGLGQLFWRRNENTFLNEMNLGTESDLIIDLWSGTAKYANHTYLTVTPRVTEGYVDKNRDRVGVFVEGKCRGVGVPGIPFYVFYQGESEQVEVHYYNESRGGIYTHKTPLTVSGGLQEVEMEF